MVEQSTLAGLRGPRLGACPVGRGSSLVEVSQQNDAEDRRLGEQGEQRIGKWT